MASAAGQELIISEGEPDVLTWATLYPDLPVLGVVAGAWTDELAERIPTGALVAIWTDANRAGDRYADQIEASLRGRCRVKRRKRQEVRRAASGKGTEVSNG